jgi:hypothetical protein
MQQTDNIKSIFDSHSELDELLKVRLCLVGKKCKTGEEKTILKDVKKKLKKIFKKFEAELFTYPLNTSMSAIAIKNRGIDLYNYSLQKTTYMLFINKFLDSYNMQKQIGEVCNILYNNVLKRDDNEIEKVNVFIRNMNNEARNLIMNTSDISDLVTGKISGKEFSKLCQVC